MGLLILLAAFYIPECILVEILSRLPAKSLLRFKCVDKLWCNLISNRDFVSMHLNNYVSTYVLVNCYDDDTGGHLISLLSPTTNTNLSSVDVELPSVVTNVESFGSYRIHSSCNGVVCLQGHVDRIALWNPAIQDFKLLPESNNYPNLRGNYDVVIGFGFDAITNDYKILQTGLRGQKRFELYSLHSDSWKKLKRPRHSVRRSYHWSGGTSLLYKNRNTLFWIASGKDTTKLLEIWKIVSFDLSDEKFGIIKFPPHIATLRFDHEGMLFPFKESIALITRPNKLYHPRMEFYDVWVMSDDFSSTPAPTNSSWIKLLSIRATDVVSPFENILIGFSGDGQILFLDRYLNVILYGLLTTQKIDRIECNRLLSAKAFGFKESLVAISQLRN